tara:strand:+ start:714 stop:2498 length:1785 start_codon:yes stop_codon:yes gene_type:complete
VSVATTVEIRGIDKTKAAFASVRKSMGNLNKSVGGLKTAVAGLLGTAALGALAGKLRSTADDIGKLATSLNIGTDSVQKFRFAAELGGVEVSAFDQSLRKFAITTGDAFDGVSTAVDAFNRLGVSIRDTQGKIIPFDELLLRTADGFKNLAGTGQEAAIANDLFGRSGVKLLPFLTEGREAIEGAGRAFETYGGVIDEKGIRTTEQFNDRITLLKNSMLEFFSPVIQVANDALSPFFEKAELAAKPLPELLELVQKQINEFDSLRKTGKAVSKEFKFFGLTLEDVIQTEEEVRAEAEKQFQILAKRRDEIRAQINLIKEQKAAQIEAVKAQIEVTNAANDAAIAQENLNAKLAQQRMLYGEGMAVMDESAAKLREHIDERNRLEAESSAQRREDQFNEFLEFEASENRRIEIIKQNAERKKRLEEEAKNIAISQIKSLSDTLANESRELFNLNKAASIAMVYVNAAEAASKVYSQLGVFGPIAAGAIYALAIANIGKIASQNYPERQAGGDVRPGETYLVGEKGPELLKMGQYGGNVTPNRNLAQGVIINIYDGTGRKINQAMSDLRVEVVQRAQQFGEFAALESKQFSQDAFA